MDIESYDLYHIGIKLNTNVLNFDMIKKNLLPKLAEKDFNIVEEPKATLDLKTGILKSENIILAEFDGVEVKFNMSTMALNFVGDNPEIVRKAFEDCIGSIEDIGWDLNQVFLFFELAIKATLKTDNNPIVVIKNSSKINLEQFEGINNIAVSAIKVTSEGKDPSNKNWFNLVIEPKLVSPTTRYSIGVLFRHESKDEMLAFQVGVEEMIIQMIVSMEGI